MVYNYDLVRLGDSYFFAKWHYQGQLLTCTFQASCLDEAERKAVANFKQKVYTDPKLKTFGGRSEWLAKLYNIADAKESFDPEVSTFKKPNLPKIWEVKKCEQPDGTFSWQTIKHECPLMDENEAKRYILEQTFSD